jgi:hypothetical protein
VAIAALEGNSHSLASVAATNAHILQEHSSTLVDERRQRHTQIQAMLAKASKSHAISRKPYNQLKKEFDLDTKRELKFVEICRKDA